MKMQFIISLFSFCFLLPFQGYSQLASVSGFVKNASTGEAKKNATVFESVSGVGTITNSEGYYKLLLHPGQQKLEISGPGFHKYTSSFNLFADTVISVELVPYGTTMENAFAEKELELKSDNTQNPEKTKKPTKLSVLN